MEIARMDIKELNFAIDVLSHPQSADASDIKEGFRIAIETLKAWKKVMEEIKEQESKRYSMSFKNGVFGQSKVDKED